MNIAERTFRGGSYAKPVGRSLYGWRDHPITGKLQFHYGIDYATGRNNLPVYCLEEGIVTVSSYDAINGNHVWIKYPRIDLEAFYGHLHKSNVVAGQFVNGNTILGLTGTTGRSSGIHLHMGVRHISTGRYFDHINYDWQKFKVDGVWDKQFMRDLQFYEGTTIDGIMSGQRKILRNVQKMMLGPKGSELIRSIQKKLKLPINGQLDERTIRTMQAWCGTAVDGLISPRSSMVRRIQELMNQGAQLWV